MVRCTVVVSLIVCAVLAASGCGRDEHPQQKPALSTPPGTDLPGDFRDSGQGALNSAKTLPGLDPQLEDVTSLAARINYTSTSGWINEAAVRVTGTVFAPKGTPPPGGWPIVAFGHPITGIRADCAPSLSPTLMGSSGIVTELVKAGYVVSVPDYQGLGLDNIYHPFLDPTTAGYNLIDSISAIRKIVPHTSDKWVAFGVSQGGQAAWAANELVENHSMGMRLMGSVSVSPTAKISGLADAAAAGTLTKDQKLVLQGFLATLKTALGDGFNLDDYRRGVVRDNWDALNACPGTAGAKRAKIADQITPDDLRPASAAALDRLRGFLEKSDLPQGPTSAPMLVIYGGQDAVVPGPWTEQALSEACKMGDVIQNQLQPDKGGDNVDISTALNWIGQRMNNVPAPNDCPLLH